MPRVHHVAGESAKRKQAGWLEGACFHTVKGKTKKQGEKARNDLILALERKDGAAGTRLTVAEFVKMFVDAKAASGTIENSTVRDYRMQTRTIARYIGDIEVAESVPLPCVLT